MEHLTLKAKEVLEGCDVVVGYKSYIDLLSSLIKGKEVFSTGMAREVERCQKAIEWAMEGRRVALVSSGDAGIYGMAGLVLELMFNRHGSEEREKGRKGERERQFPDSPIPRFSDSFEIQVIPGVPAFCAAGALLGAPLMHDFASISLSDLLTPWETIKRRLEMAGLGDFVVILYNPKSRKRTKQLQEAVEIISRYRKGNTPVGIVKDATRDGERVEITTLGEISRHYASIDMSTILIVGNSKTFTHSGRMITPRGYPLRQYLKGLPEGL